MEYLANQKLENTPESDSPMSNDFPESSMVIPANWPSQQSIPVPDHVPVPQLIDFDAYPAVPSHRPPIVKTYYCLWRAVGNDLMFEVEVINPKDNQRDVAKED